MVDDLENKQLLEDQQMNLYVSSSDSNHQKNKLQNPESKNSSFVSLTKMSNQLCEFGAKSEGGESIKPARKRFGNNFTLSRSTSRGSLHSKKKNLRTRSKSFESVDMINSISFETPYSYGEENFQSFEIF
jgi:hypothetical protein